MALSIKLSAFEGPLDLLMHLIEKDKIDIYDIPIVSITEQYIAYLRRLSDFDMELASEFLVMAATLLQIKSRLLLPKNEADEEEESDPRQQLVEMLVEYRRVKQQAARLAECKRLADRHFYRAPMFGSIEARVLPDYSIEDLLRALAAVLSGSEGSMAAAYIEPQAFSVQEKMAELLARLQKCTGGLLLSDLCGSGHKGEKVASFLGVLELLKLNLIRISQSRAFAPIYIFPKDKKRDGLEEAADGT